MKFTETIDRKPWPFFGGGAVVIIGAGAFYATLYLVFLARFDKGPPLASFEPIFIYPLVLLDVICFLFLVAYKVFCKASLLLTAVLLKLFQTWAVARIASEIELARSFQDFSFRILAATIPTSGIILISTIFLLISKKKLDLDKGEETAVEPDQGFGVSF